MKALARQLTAWLLGGLGLIWLSAGLLGLATVRRSLEGRFDAELRAMASEVRHLLPEGRPAPGAKPSSYWFDFYQPGSGLYFEAWDEFLLFSDRSASLGDRELPRPEAFGEEPRFWNARLDDGERVRLIAQRFMQFPPGGGAEGFPIHVVVARNRIALDRTLRLAVAATILTGALLVPLTFLVVRLAVGRGLRPLRQFADRTVQFDIGALHERFETADLPAELVPISRRLNELLERLAAGIERERRLNQDLAHELKTPVAELKAMAEVALLWPERISAAQYREVLEVATQMQAVIDNMLLLARWERSPERPAMEPVDLGEMVRRCWQPHAGAAAGKRLHVRILIPSGTSWPANPELLRMVVGNLISNAVEYSPEGGEIGIEHVEDSGGRDLVFDNPAEHLAPGDVPHLFERFWRADAARHGTGHAGLGLPLAKTCAGIMGLSLAAELDERTKQLRFRLHLPRRLAR